MVYQMNLYTNKKLFPTLINLTAKHFSIAPAFVEKDYWITLSLYKLSQSAFAESVVFKGGTSLSKGYRLINRFSEDIDIATINENLSGNALKSKIRSIEKTITSDFTEIVEPGITSKGSMFRKSVFEYKSIITGKLSGNIPKRIIVEINSFANPYPFGKQGIYSFIAEFLLESNQQKTIEQYGLQPFLLNVLDKQRTMIEKIVSLIRFSFSENPSTAIAAKIRHFYDLYFLANDTECMEYIRSDAFRKDFEELLVHDQQTFNEPADWQNKNVAESPLATDLPALWEKLRHTYQNELVVLAFSAVPDEKDVAECFIQIMNRLTKK